MVRTSFASAGFSLILRVSCGVRAANDPAIARVLLGGVVASLLLATGTGIALDRPRLQDVVEAKTVPIPRVDLRTWAAPRTLSRASKRVNEEEEDENEGWLRELHEFSANMMLLFVGLARVLHGPVETPAGDVHAVSSRAETDD